MCARLSSPPTQTRAARPMPIETGHLPPRTPAKRRTADPTPQSTNAAAFKTNAPSKILNAFLRGEKQCAWSDGNRAMFDEPPDRLFEPLAQRNSRLPTERL